SGYVRAVLLRDLHAEAPHATGRPGDRDPLTCPELRVITQRFECHISCDRDPCRLLETQTVGLWDDLVRCGGGAFGQGSSADSEHRVTNGQIGYVGTESLNDPGEIEAPHLLLWTPPTALRTQEPTHHEVVCRVERGRTHSDEDSVGFDRRATDLGDLESLRTSVTALHNRSHRASPS